MDEFEMPGFNESEFSIYNPDGRLRVQRSLTAIQDARRRAQRPAEMEHVLRRTKEPLRLNFANKVIAKAKFVKARGRAAHHLREASAKFARCTSWGMKRVEMQLHLEHAVPHFGAKHFTEAQAVAGRIVAELVSANVFFSAATTPKPVRLVQTATRPFSTQGRRSA
jgi:hypothetical protein